MFPKSFRIFSYQFFIFRHPTLCYVRRDRESHSHYGSLQLNDGRHPSVRCSLRKYWSDVWSRERWGGSTQCYYTHRPITVGERERSTSAAAVAFVVLTRRRNNVGQGPFGCIRCVFRARSSTRNTKYCLPIIYTKTARQPAYNLSRLYNVIIVIE